MLIYDGNSIKQLSLHPLAIPKYEHENVVWIEDEDIETNLVKPVLTIKKALSFIEEIEDDIIAIFLNNVVLSSLSTSQFLETVMQQYDLPKELSIITHSTSDSSIIMLFPTTQFGNIPVEIEPGKTLNINSQLSSKQKQIC